ncbi:phage/plasmid primase, P4 family [Halanaerobium sp. Z-7514]|uniref:Phage/plasmid primase, P4 family n=1 Tax=Halanaerobium polyolivorans TaxID=2886943 RepID=A0AAW4X1W5_9FIRM|nr:phage/plasmid primase, P4 family [Halanaerobium polyolivorans]MCC3145795.1 phage/plasmid primase, P4 family [Halanaerobium polyolivorans]
MSKSTAIKGKSFDYRSKLINEIKSVKKLTFNPRDIGLKVLKYLSEDKGIKYKYVTKKQLFMRYENGVWKEEYVKKKGCYLRKVVTDFLADISYRFNRRSKVNEVVRNIMHEVSDVSKNDDVFDPANQPKRLINFKNLIFDAVNQKKLPHDSKHHLIYQLPVDYSDKAECPLWEKTLKEWINDEDTILFLQEFIGYMMTTYNCTHKFVIFYGGGSNGKSVFLNIVESLLGDSYHSMGLKRFTERTRWTAHDLVGKLANICSDIDYVKFKYTGLIKKLSGGDSVEAEIKGGETYNYEPIIKLLFSANKLPEAKNLTHGFYRRLEIVNFPNKFSPNMENYDPQLTSKLKTELPGIARWAINGLIRFLENGKQFTISDTMRIDLLNYMDQKNVFSEFLEEFVVETDDPDDYIVSRNLYNIYKDWAERNNLDVKTIGKLTSYIKDNKIGLSEQDSSNYGAKVKNIDGKSKRCYIGIKLKKQK